MKESERSEADREGGREGGRKQGLDSSVHTVSPSQTPA